MFAFVAFLLLLVGAESSDSWNYCNQDQWKENCGSLYQSPIDLGYNLWNQDFSFMGLRQLQFLSYGSSVCGEWHNNGHTLKFTPYSYYNTKLDAFDNSNSYDLTQFHIHWPRSEHAVNGYKYNAEIPFCT